MIKSRRVDRPRMSLVTPEHAAHRAIEPTKCDGCDGPGRHLGVCRWGVWRTMELEFIRAALDAQMPAASPRVTRRG